MAPAMAACGLQWPPLTLERLGSASLSPHCRQGGARCPPLGGSARATSGHGCGEGGSWPVCSTQHRKVRAGQGAHRSRRRMLSVWAMAPEAAADSAGPNLAVLLEVEGVLADVHRLGHREAFNITFRMLELACANWTETVYSDLLRRGGGSEERMLQHFFNQIGWPLAVPTSEKDLFVRKCIQIKEGALKDLISSGKVPLRPGVKEFIAELVGAGVSVSVLAAGNKVGEEGCRLLVELLGEELGNQVQIVGSETVANSAFAQVMQASGVKDTPQEQLAAHVQKAAVEEKQRIAEQVASRLEVSVELDTGSGSGEQIAALRAAVELSGQPLDRCVLVAGGQTGVQAAARLGLPCVVIKSSMTSRAEFPDSRGSYEDFGSGSGLTLERLQRLLEKEASRT